MKNNHISLVVEALKEILTPDNAGKVVFGKEKEPFRPAQIEALTAIKDNLEQGVKRGYIVQPGGSGKTREAIALAYAMHKHGKKTLFVVPTTASLEDFADKAKTLCPDLGVGKVYSEEKNIGNLTFITYSSLLSRINNPNAKPAINPNDYDLLVWDEAHSYLNNNAKMVMEKFPDAVQIGFTASPKYYTGKEVSQTFGKKFYELSFDTAKERKETSDYRNVLIKTNITTGLSPDLGMEEGVEVGKAINVKERNAIFPEIYRDTTFKVEGKGEFSIFGEPTLVFTATIDHANDLAKAFDDALMPLVKNDEKFRAALRAKNIDPDKIEHIAEAVHRGETESHDSMSIKKRNDVIKRYDERKTLVLTSTSLLQQSFDSPKTSVVMDTVPRQTYVGVGQAGMRATRPKEGKMSFIINTRDEDRPSLTFTDFVRERGSNSEEGVAVTILPNQNPYSKTGSKTDNSEQNIAPYKMVYSQNLLDEVNKNQQREQLEDALSPHRYYTPEEYKQLNILLARIQQGDTDAKEQLIKKTLPNFEAMALRVACRILQKTPQELNDQERDVAHDTCIDNLLRVIGNLKTDEITISPWHSFSSSIHSGIIQSIKNQYLVGERGDLILVDEANSRAKINGILSKTHNIPFEDAAHSGLKRDVEKVLDGFTPRKQMIIKSRILGDKDDSLNELALEFGISGGRTQQIAAQALCKLRSSPIQNKFRDDGEDPVFGDKHYNYDNTWRNFASIPTNYRVTQEGREVLANKVKSHFEFGDKKSWQDVQRLTGVSDDIINFFIPPYSYYEPKAFIKMKEAEAPFVQTLKQQGASKEDIVKFKGDLDVFCNFLNRAESLGR